MPNNRTIGKEEELSEKIVMLIAQGKNKKEIANTEKINYDFVMHVAKTRAPQINQKKVELERQKKEEKSKKPVYLEMGSVEMSLYIDYLQGISPLQLSKNYHLKKDKVMEIIKFCKGDDKIDEEASKEVIKRAKQDAVTATIDGSNTKTKRGNYDDETVLKVVDDYQKGYSIMDICKKNHISNNALYSIMYDFYGSKEKFVEEAARKPGRVNTSDEKESRAPFSHKKKTLIMATPTITKAVYPVEKTKETVVDGHKIIKPTIKPKPIIKTPQPQPAPQHVQPTTAKTTIVREPKEFEKYGVMVKSAAPHKNEVLCELIKDRHETGQDLAIFTGDDIPGDQVVDYKWQESVIEKFIDERLHFNVNGSVETLTVYISGLQTVLISLVNVCARRNVHLDVMHYHHGAYYRQHVGIDDNNDTDVIDRTCRLKMIYKNVYSIGDAIEADVDDIVGISISYHDDNGSLIPNEGDVILVKKDDSWNTFGQVVQYIRTNTDHKFSVFMKPMVDRQGTLNFVKDQCLAKSFNFITTSAGIVQVVNN